MCVRDRKRHVAPAIYIVAAAGARGGRRGEGPLVGTVVHAVLSLGLFRFVGAGGWPDSPVAPGAGVKVYAEPKRQPRGYQRDDVLGFQKIQVGHGNVALLDECCNLLELFLLFRIRRIVVDEFHGDIGPQLADWQSLG